MIIHKAKTLCVLFFTLLLMMLSGCSSMKIDDFRDQKPALSLESYFLGQTWAWGIFEDRFGKLRRSFQVEIDGSMNGDTLVLDERFLYDDGETATRIWEIQRSSTNSYTGTAGDIVGQAVGVVAGNALNWRYTMDLPVGENTWRVDFNDWMFLRPGNVMINKAEVTKWGIHLGTVTLFFSKVKPEQPILQPIEQ